MEDGSMFVLLNLSCAPTTFNISMTTSHLNAKKKSLANFHNVVKIWYDASYLFFLQIKKKKKLKNMVLTYRHDVFKKNHAHQTNFEKKKKEFSIVL
jgi:hypothetical protein